MIYGYVRVSTGKQDGQSQLDGEKKRQIRELQNEK